MPAKEGRLPVPKTETTTRISQVGTIGVPVKDQDRALGFYVEKLGFETRMDASYGEGQRWIEVAPPGASTTIALVQSESAGVDTQVRFTTDDATADHAALRTQGVEADELIPYPVPMFIFRDPDGNQLIIVERPSAE
jgi:catechol 2,3-dioxygenase-like lactoylglutathione lyase family enzyme